MKTQFPPAWSRLLAENWTPPTHVLSIRQPWAWLIAAGHKDIENRTWRTNYRGRILIHASKTCRKIDLEDCVDFLRSIRKWKAVSTGWPVEFETGGIVGEAEIVDCVEKSRSPWFGGPVGFVLKAARPLPFVACKGMLGICEFKAVGKG